MPRVLELFSGTGSVGCAFAELGWNVWSLDLDSKVDPDICCDIMCFPYYVFNPTFFDHVHASPPCTEYSKAKTVGVRKLDMADRIVERTVEIIRYFQCSYSIENPAGGAYTLEKRPMLIDLPRYLVTYCKFDSDRHPYRKPTNIWTDLEVDFPPPCLKHSRCRFFDGRHHPQTAQRGTQANYTDRSSSISQLHSMPPKLCRTIADAAHRRVQTATNVIPI